MSKTIDKKNTQNTRSPKKLSLAAINKLDKENNKTKKVSLLDGQYRLDIDLIFRESKIQRLLIDFFDIFTIFNKKKTTMEDAKNVSLLFNILLIKHFTNLGLNSLDMSKERDCIKAVEIAEKLIDIGIFDGIYNSFPKEEIEKIQQRIEKSKEYSTQMGDILLKASLDEQNKYELYEDDFENNTPDTEDDINGESEMV